MKYKILKAILCFLFIIPSSLFAQEGVTLPEGDYLIVNLDGYKQGVVSWEQSTDNENWEEVDNNTEKASLYHQMNIPKYLRAKVTDETCDPIFSEIIQANIEKDNSGIVKAGHGFAVPYNAANTGLLLEEKGELSGWTDTNMKAEWYLYQTAGEYALKFDLTATGNKTYNFELTCSQCTELGFETISQKIQFTGTGSRMLVNAMPQIIVDQTGYYKYELKAEGDANGLTMHELEFNTIATPGKPQVQTGRVSATDYLSSPSVHLSFRSPKTNGKDYDWFYQEIMVPTGYAPVGSYWMSIGFDGGYFGIQANSETERRVLFSAWDKVDLDEYKKEGIEPPVDLLVSLVDKASYTRANAFGNEGTGGQSYVGVGRNDTWIEENPVKFLLNVQNQVVDRVESSGTIPNTIVSAWYNAHEEEGWRYIATWRVPMNDTHKQTDYYKDFYSFIENYIWRNGNLPRKGYYYNAFGRNHETGEWIHFNEVGFSNTDGKEEGQRFDFEQGVAPEDPTKFYMLSGGFGGTRKTENKVDEITSYDYLDNLDLKPFTDRVEQALEAEAILKNMEFIDKSGWSVIEYSSEETSGEQPNGYARLIIDGNTSTYWHSAYNNGGSSYPHKLTIDMGKQETVRGFKFVLSDSSRRWMKDILIETSDDNVNWRDCLETETPSEVSYLLQLDAPETFRYFRLTIFNSHDDYDGDHVRINEIDAY